MPEIELDDPQLEYLDQLRTELAEEHVGEYGHVRHRDAVQFLIDRYETSDGEINADSTDPGTSAGTARRGENDAEDDDGDDAEDGGGDDDSDDGATRLERMMGLLDRHEDVWEQDDHDEGKYAVSLPDGTTEHVRTKDDVRALLFRHYD